MNIAKRIYRDLLRELRGRFIGAEEWLDIVSFTNQFNFQQDVRKQNIKNL